MLLVWQHDDPGFLLFRYADGTEFVIDRGGSRIWATWAKSSTLEDTVVYLTGPVMGMVLRLRGTVPLHASAVSIDGRAVVFLGAAGAGKSTLAAAFVQSGYRILSDDVAALARDRDTIRVLAGPSRLRLWPDSVSLLYGSPDALPLMTPNWDKWGLDLTPGWRAASVPLAAIYVLGRPRCDPREISFEPCPLNPLLLLVGNSYVNYLLDAPQRAHEFDLLSHVASTVPICMLKIPRGSTVGLPEVCRSIAGDFRQRCGTT